MKYIYVSTFLLILGVNILGQPPCNISAEHVVNDCKPYLHVSVSINFPQDCEHYKVNGDTTLITWGFTITEDCEDAYWHCFDNERFTWQDEFEFIGQNRSISFSTYVEINEPHKPHAINAGLPCAIDSGMSCWFVVSPGDSLPYSLITIYDTMFTELIEYDTIVYYDTIPIYDTIQFLDTIPVYQIYEIETGIDPEAMQIKITSTEIICNFPYESIKIYTLDGILLGETSSIAHLSNGVYILDLQCKGQIIRMKFLKH